MKIVHICLSNYYIDGYSYQENEIVKQHVKYGHDVTVIASTESFDEKGKLRYVKSSKYLSNDGAKVVRLPYRKTLPHAIMKKLRMHKGVFRLLVEEKPDVVMFHGLCGWELINVTHYCTLNPHVKYYIDSHEDFNNSARSFVSKYILHKLYYANIIRSQLHHMSKILCISLETIEFVVNMYGVSRNKLEFFPLGGHVFDDIEYDIRRDSSRQKLNVDDKTILCLQTGKFGKRKKLIESLIAFNKTTCKSLNLILAGVIDDEISAEALSLIDKDERIKFIGWKSSEEIKDLLCAADLYIQPGTQSATMQMSLCARCPVILDDVLSHKPYLNDNGWLVKNQIELENALASADLDVLKDMSMNSLKIAKKLLNYENLAARVLD